MSDLIKTYEELDQEEKRLASALADVKAKKSAAVKSIFDTLGKGPHTVHGQSVIPVSRGDTWFLKAPPSKRSASV